MSLILLYVARLAHYLVRLTNLQQFWNCISAAGTKKERRFGLNMLTKSLEPRKRKPDVKDEEESEEASLGSSGEDSERKDPKKPKTKDDMAIVTEPFFSTDTHGSEDVLTTAAAAVSRLDMLKSQSQTKTGLSLFNRPKSPNVHRLEPETKTGLSVSNRPQSPNPHRPEPPTKTDLSTSDRPKSANVRRLEPGTETGMSLLDRPKSANVRRLEPETETGISLLDRPKSPNEHHLEPQPKTAASDASDSVVEVTTVDLVRSWEGNPWKVTLEVAKGMLPTFDDDGLQRVCIQASQRPPNFGNLKFFVFIISISGALAGVLTPRPGLREWDSNTRRKL